MTATDELRRLLDERGVEHVDYGGKGHEDEVGRPATWWSGEHGECTAVQRDDVRLLTVEVFLTPAQAIDATLGRGTCHAEEQYLDSHSDLTVTVCSECGVPTDDLEDCNYCPNCGRKVVE